jgi:sodium/proline symporter
VIEFGFVLYLAIIAAIGFHAWRRTATIADYLLVGRRIGAGVAALSAGASDMSGWLLLGLPGLAVLAPGSAVLTATGLLLGTWCNWSLVARPLRAASATLGALTLPDFLACRFPDRARPLRGLTALVIVGFFLLYTSAGLVAGAKLFNTVFGMPYPLAVASGAVVILLYTLFGGFLAVAWTDAFQAALMIAALLLVSIMLSANAAPVTAVAPTLDGAGALGTLSALAWGLGYFGQPHILARFMALEHIERVATARRIAVGWTALGLSTAVVIGIAGAPLVAGGDAERVFILAVDALFSPWLAGFLLAAILAAIMSTADSQLLVTAAALAEDLIPMLRQGRPGERERLRDGRRAVLVVGLGAALLALDPQAGVFELVARAWAGFGATIGPALLIALYRPRASGTAALAGMVTGAAVVLIWPSLPAAGFGLYELAPAFCAALIVNLGVDACRPASQVGV